MKETNKTLTIDLSEEYKIKIEDPDKLKGSFFEEIYLKAAVAVDDIITQTEKSINETDKSDPFQNEKQDYNNIIAFCGERGTGKSSAMISFAQSLLKLKTSLESKNFYAEKELIKKNFHTIQVIDPSLFEEHENIFEVILAQLFSSFEKELNKKEKESELNAKRELLEQFEKVYENLQTIKKNGQKYDGEALETLNKLACGANLRQNFKKLVKLYLHFIVGKENCDNAYLIIPVDDFDLNVNAAAEMAEQIRKYLMIPKVFVFMAVKIEQLADAKEQQIRKDFKTLINADRLSDSPDDIASKYLLKLIPIKRRIEMPILGDSLDSCSLSIKKKTTTSEYRNIFQGFQVECFHKAKLFLSIREFTDIGIFPRTLREIVEYFNILNNNKTEKDFIDFLIIQFRGRTPNQARILEKLISLPNTQKNYYLINAITEDLFFTTQTGRRVISNTLEISTQSKVQYLSILLDTDNKPHNITLGDLLFFFKIILESKYSPYYKDLINLVKIIYSIWLTTKKDRKKYSQILELTNGSVYEPNYREVIRSEKKILRSKFAILDFGKLNINGASIEGAFTKKLTPETVKKIHWLAYFIEYPKNSKYAIYSAESDSIFYYKDDVVSYYKREMDIGRGSIVKDPIFNVLNVLTSCLDLRLPFKKAFNSYYSNVQKEKKSEYRSYMKESFISQMASWREKHQLVIPYNNIFLYEHILSQIDTDLKIAESGYHSYVVFLFSQIKDILENICKIEPLLKDQKVLESFVECPIIQPILENDDKYLSLLNDLKSSSSNIANQDASRLISKRQAALNALKRLSTKKSIVNAINTNRQVYVELALYDYFMNKLNQGINPSAVKSEIISVLSKNK